MTISALGAGWGSLGITILGFSTTTWSGQALPIPLAAFGAPGCLQLVAADATGMATGNLSGNIDLTFALPQNHGMLAYNLYAQFAIADPTANALGFVFTNGVDIQVTM